MNRNRIAMYLSVLTAAGLAACNPPSASDAERIDVGAGSRSTARAAGCPGSDNPICLGVKYVAYRNATGQAVASEATARANLETSNRVWSACGIGFRLESFQTVDPRDYALTYGGSRSAAESYTIRRTFQDRDTFLVVTTGPWGTTKNAWTEPPNGSGLYGVVMEGSVAGNGNILAHELGHYLSLDHVGTPANVMSTVIYPSSTQLTQAQCAKARDIAVEFWPLMLR